MGYCINATDFIGNTPLVKLAKFADNRHIQGLLLGKVEAFNPTGSIKDRPAYRIISHLVCQGLIKSGQRVVCPSSGNFGISVAMTASAFGLGSIIVMPENFPKERQQLIAAYGGEVYLTRAALGMDGALKAARALCEGDRSLVFIDQFNSLLNPTAHYLGTGPEIWKQTDGRVTFVVAGIGTGATVSGVGRFLKEKNPDVKIVGVEPSSSPLISSGKSGSHSIYGIGPNFIPETLSLDLLDRVITVTDEEAFSFTKRLVKDHGLFCGISSGAAFCAAVKYVESFCMGDDKKPFFGVVILPDSFDRYLSLGLFERVVYERK